MYERGWIIINSDDLVMSMFVIQPTLNDYLISFCDGYRCVGLNNYMHYVLVGHVMLSNLVRA